MSEKTTTNVTRQFYAAASKFTSLNFKNLESARTQDLTLLPAKDCIDGQLPAYYKESNEYGMHIVGTATLSVDFSSEADVRAGLVSVLQDAKRAVLAKAQKDATEIEQKIQSLLAISFDQEQP